MGQGDRTFNSRGQTIYDQVQTVLTVLFVGIMIIYAGVRGHRVVTQLPATYRTTQAPKTFTGEYLSRVFTNKLPEATYEFPAMTFCPPSRHTTLKYVSCFRNSTTGIQPCATNGIYERTVNFEREELQCTTVNDIPGDILFASSADDVLEIVLQVTGTSTGSPQGALVATHRQIGPPNTPAGRKGEDFNYWGYDNFFGASAYTSTEIVGKKLYQIQSDGTFNVDYEVKASSLRINMDVPSSEAGMKPFVNIEFRYPKLEATYEKPFLVLDMNNWLGEVGGVSALLYFLQKVVMLVVSFVLKRSDSFAYTDLGKEFRSEGFAHY